MRFTYSFWMVLLAASSCHSAKVPVYLPPASSGVPTAVAEPEVTAISTTPVIPPAPAPAPVSAPVRAVAKLLSPPQLSHPDTSHTLPPLAENYPRDPQTMTVNAAGGAVAAVGTGLLLRGLAKHETWSPVGGIVAVGLLLGGLLLLLYRRHQSRRRQLAQAIREAYPGRTTDFLAVLLKMVSGLMLLGGVMLLVASMVAADGIGLLFAAVGIGLGLPLLLYNDPGSLRGHWREQVHQYRETQRQQGKP